MKKYWIKSIFILFFLVGLSSWIYFFPYQKHVAQEATDQYLKAQKVPKGATRSRKTKRDWKTGGYVVTIEYKTDPDLLYEYMYHRNSSFPYHVFLTVYKFGSSVEDNEVKYPPLPDRH